MCVCVCVCVLYRLESEEDVQSGQEEEDTSDESCMATLPGKVKTRVATKEKPRDSLKSQAGKTPDVKASSSARSLEREGSEVWHTPPTSPSSSSHGLTKNRPEGGDGEADDQGKLPQQATPPPSAGRSRDAPETPPQSSKRMLRKRQHRSPSSGDSPPSGCSPNAAKRMRLDITPPATTDRGTNTPTDKATNTPFVMEEGGATPTVVVLSEDPPFTPPSSEEKHLVRTANGRRIRRSTYSVESDRPATPTSPNSARRSILKRRRSGSEPAEERREEVGVATRDKGVEEGCSKNIPEAKRRRRSTYDVPPERSSLLSLGSGTESVFTPRLEERGKEREGVRAVSFDFTTQSTSVGVAGPDAGVAASGMKDEILDLLDKRVKERST